MQPSCAGGTAWFMQNDPRTRVLSVVERLPEWLRHDLAVREEAARKRAEETLAGMIVGALTEQAES